MSARLIIKVGAYIECKTIFKEIEKVVLVCNDCKKDYSNYSDQKFCSSCGKELIKKVKDKIMVINDDIMYDLTEKMNQSFYSVVSTNKTLFIPNVKGYIIEINSEDEDVFSIEISPDIIKHILNKFNNDFKDKIKMIEEVYNDIHVRFGVYSYWT